MADIHISVSVADGSNLPVYRVGAPLNKADLYKEISPNTLYTNVVIRKQHALCVKFFVPEDATMVEVNFPRVHEEFTFFGGSLWIAQEPSADGFLPWGYARFLSKLGETVDVVIPGWYWILVYPEVIAAYQEEDFYISMDFEVLVYTSKQQQEIGQQIETTGEEIRRENERTAEDIQTQISTALDEIYGYLTNLQNQITSSISNISSSVISSLSGTITTISQILSDIASSVISSLYYVAEIIGRYVSSAIETLLSVLSQIFERLFEYLRVIYDLIREYLERLWRFISEVVAEAIAEFVKWFKQTMEKLPQRFAEAFESIIFEEV